MAIHTIKGFIVCDRSRYSRALSFDFMTYEPTSDVWPERTTVSPHEFDVEVPDDYNPVPQLVANLEEQKRLKRVKLAQELAAIDDQISKLTCIEHTLIASEPDDIPF